MNKYAQSEGIKVDKKKFAIRGGGCCLGALILIIIIGAFAPSSNQANKHQNSKLTKLGKSAVTITVNTITPTLSEDELTVVNAINQAGKIQCSNDHNGTANSVSYSDWGKTVNLINSFNIDNTGNLTLSFNSQCGDKVALEGYNQDTFNYTSSLNLNVTEAQTAMLVTILKSATFSKAVKSLNITASLPAYNSSCNDLSLTPVYAITVSRLQYKYFNYITVILVDGTDSIAPILKKEGIKENIIQNFNACKVSPTPTTLSQKQEADFKASCDPVTTSEVDKAGSDFTSHNVYIKVKILKLLKDSTGTTAGANVTDDNSASIIQVAFDGFVNPLEINEGDTIEVWGTGQGVVSGTNIYGATVYESSVQEKYMYDDTNGQSFDI